MNDQMIDKLLEYHARQKSKMFRSYRSLVKNRHDTIDRNLLAHLMDSDKRRYKFHKEGIDAILQLREVAHGRD
jgi:hypothetical protein